jgi:tetrahydromethanopterin S-methyltransferase subunit B
MKTAIETNVYKAKIFGFLRGLGMVILVAFAVTVMFSAERVIWLETKAGHIDWTK